MPHTQLRLRRIGLMHHAHTAPTGNRAIINSRRHCTRRCITTPRSERALHQGHTALGGHIARQHNRHPTRCDMRGVKRLHDLRRESAHRGRGSARRHAIARTFDVQEFPELFSREAARFYALLQ